jgi:5-methyltetrahydrofolate--homocysteine methyltransferase
MTHTNILESMLASSEYLLADGAMGTVLMAAGLEHGDPPEEWNTLHPAKVRAVHRSYIEAGSQIILTNSFGGTRFRLKLHNLQSQVVELNRAAAELARAEADAAARDVVVAGSMGPSGELLEPLGTLTFEEARDGFAEQAAALIEGGVDVLWIETMSDLREVAAAVEGVRSVSDRPVVTTMTFDTRGHTMMGVSPVQALAALRELGSLALGANCGNGPAEIERVIQAMHAADPAVALVAKSNAGIPELIDGEVRYSGTPEVMARYAVRVRDLGARIIGLCCGSTPAHLRAVAEALAG